MSEATHESKTTADPWIGWRIDKAQWHFHKRLHERYAIILSFGEVEALMDEIRRGKALLIARSKHAAEATYGLRVQGRAIQVVANPGTGKFITAFPENRRAIFSDRKHADKKCNNTHFARRVNRREGGDYADQE
jgi:hypothetical protein